MSHNTGIPLVRKIRRALMLAVRRDEETMRQEENRPPRVRVYRAHVNVILPILRAQFPPRGRSYVFALGRLLGNEAFGIAREINLI
jgi:hypothetical protein